MAQKGFYIDVNKCTGCRVCQVACKDVNDLDAGVLFRAVTDYEAGAFPNPKAYKISLACNHCASPACVAICPTGAMYKRESDGVVLVDESLCDGCQKCVEICPYGAPKYIESLGKVRKCQFCEGKIQEGEQPACVASCLMRAIEYGDIEELRAKYGDNADIEGLPDSTATGPSLVINPHRDLA